MPQKLLNESMRKFESINEDEPDTCEEAAAAKSSGAEELIERQLLKQRRIFLWGEVDDASMKEVMSKMLYLESKDAKAPIEFFINTPGGSIMAGVAVYDLMCVLQNPIHVTVTGMAASMGSILLAGGARGQRKLFPHARVMIHQPLIMGRIIAPALDINIQAEEMERLREELNQILAKASGQDIEKIRNDTDRDFHLNAKEAIEYGLADSIVEDLG